MAYKLSKNNLKIKHVLIASCIVFLSVALLVSCLRISSKPEIVFKYDTYLKDTPEIRVLLLDDVKTAEISIHQPYSISNLDRSVGLVQGIDLSKSTIRLKSGKFLVEPIDSPGMSKGGGFVIEADGKVEITLHSEGGYISLNNSKYLGKILLVPGSDEHFSVLEEIGIETYLTGVVVSEIPEKWQDDAIYAQVVAARSYAVYQKKTKNNSSFHIGKLGLAYHGSYTNKLRINEIVEKTRGVVMVYDWEVMPGYFHSTCGGHTEDINLVFGLKSIPPLSGVQCGYCGKSRHYRWEKRLKKNEVERKLQNYKFDIKHIYDIVAEKKGLGGHGSTVKVKHSGGTNSFDANVFRLMVGPNILRSTAFAFKEEGDLFVFNGKGWGHGVGLCQYGMEGMAESGFQWFDILKYYYPGIDLVKIY
ncbi:MAG: SpoIID/LytB domain-containing protein [Candidatus Scalindua sp. SCAELEC01]|nr:MAG: SpoIID/LytB domain-containing protein [Candidatus Scalindua sp.]NOG86115.1 SpoIID/LytB domain-containing protein [Planctomycetota bacterium]RZV98881.1 MAG: SpoIID/LytB domain-containing protein [Candidatus Scalindua sp. SCAELEC01]